MLTAHSFVSNTVPRKLQVPRLRDMQGVAGPNRELPCRPLERLGMSTAWKCRLWRNITAQNTAWLPSAAEYRQENKQLWQSSVAGAATAHRRWRPRPAPGRPPGTLAAAPPLSRPPVPRMRASHGSIGAHPAVSVFPGAHPSRAARRACKASRVHPSCGCTRRGNATHGGLTAFTPGLCIATGADAANARPIEHGQVTTSQCATWSRARECADTH